MKCYFAGNAGLLRIEQDLLQGGIRNRLVTYADRNVKNHACCPQFWIEARCEALLRARQTARERDQALPRGGYAQGAIELLSYAMVFAQLEATTFWLNERTNERTNERPNVDAETSFDNDMKLYVAGNGKSRGSAQRDHDTGVRNRLLSYAFLNDWAKDEFQYWVNGKPQAVSVLLDSGAFSAHTLGMKIDLLEYCDYIEQHKDALEAYAVLDVIGDAVATRKNMDFMRKRGLAPLGIYHVGHDLTALHAILEEKDAYVALGGMASDRPTREELQGKLDVCWRIIEQHWPVRVHGLGVMAQWALERYPFYSVDSASAILGAGMGRVSRFGNHSCYTASSFGQFVADGWRTDVARFYDGLVADGVGRVAASESKSDSAHEGRRMRNIQAQLNMEQYITDHWTARGVTWT